MRIVKLRLLEMLPDAHIFLGARGSLSGPLALRARACANVVLIGVGRSFSR